MRDGTDFTNLARRNKAYGGTNGNKISVLIDDELYMLKFPAHANKNENMSYANGGISEYLGCKIYQSIGIPVQEVILGTYKTRNGDKIVVACKDFTADGRTLQDFASLKNQVIDSERSGYGTELFDILDTFYYQNAIDYSIISDRFWDMFVVDSLIGNWDRHNGNWGFLYDIKDDNMVLAPVYDCGSCLFPQVDDSLMYDTIHNKQALDFRVYSIPTSAINIDKKRINYHNFLSDYHSLKNEEVSRGLDSALNRIYPRIDINKISDIIDNTPFISDLQKKFYKTIISARKELILEKPYQKAAENHLGKPKKKSSYEYGD